VKSIGFLCLAHNNFDYLEALSNYCCSDASRFYLHIDKHVQIPSSFTPNDKTILLGNEERVRTRWGSIQIVDATITLLKSALKANHSHYILVSGADIPLKPLASALPQLEHERSYLSVWHEVALNDAESPHYREFFKRHNYLSNLTNPGEAYVSGSRFNIYLMLFLNKLIKLWPIKKSRFNYQKYVKGSQWFALSHQAAIYLVNEWDKSSVREQFKNMHAPDEKAIQTILLNNNCGLDIAIDRSQENNKQGVHWINWQLNNGIPQLQNIPFENLAHMETSNAIFARKLAPEHLKNYCQYVQELAKK
jgi:hypothetical protein